MNLDSTFPTPMGPTPDRRPFLCRLGFHKGARRGGTVQWTCQRCEGSFFQKRDYGAVTFSADLMIYEGRAEEAKAMAEDHVRRGDTGRS